MNAPSGTFGERKLATVLFADVVDSTSMAEKVDPEDVADIMNGAFEFLSNAVSKYGGIVARLMGDAIFAIFGAPVAFEDDADLNEALDYYQRTGIPYHTALTLQLLAELSEIQGVA